jgi:hypothetical protein
MSNLERSNWKEIRKTHDESIGIWVTKQNNTEGKNSYILNSW